MSDIKSDTKTEIPAPYQLLTGKDIKCRLYKVLNFNLTHYGFRYKIGLNVLNDPFISFGNCESGGLYVTWQPEYYLLYGVWISEVTLPDDAQVWTMPNKIKVDKLILSPPKLIGAYNLNWQLALTEKTVHFGQIFDFWQTDELCLLAVNRDAYNLAYVCNQTEEICLAAVEQEWPVISFVRNQTLDVCFAAYKQNHEALLYIKDRKMRDRIMAHYDSKEDTDLVSKVEKQTASYTIRDWIIHTVNHGWNTLAFAEQTPELCMAAVQYNGMLLQFIHKQTPELCMAAVSQNGRALTFVHEQTPEIVVCAVEQNLNAIERVRISVPALTDHLGR